MAANTPDHSIGSEIFADCGRRVDCGAADDLLDFAVDAASVDELARVALAEDLL